MYHARTGCTFTILDLYSTSLLSILYNQSQVYQCTISMLYFFFVQYSHATICSLILCTFLIPILVVRYKWFMHTVPSYQPCCCIYFASFFAFIFNIVCPYLDHSVRSPVLLISIKSAYLYIIGVHYLL